MNLETTLAYVCSPATDMLLIMYLITCNYI